MKTCSKCKKELIKQKDIVEVKDPSGKEPSLIFCFHCHKELEALYDNVFELMKKAQENSLSLKQKFGLGLPLTAAEVTELKKGISPKDPDYAKVMGQLSKSRRF